MLPNSSCGNCQRPSRWQLLCKRTANLPQEEVWTLHQGPEVALDILQQGGKGGPLMIMGDFPSRPAPEPFDPIGLRVVGGCVYDPQVVVQLRQHLAHPARACGGMGMQVIDDALIGFQGRGM